MMRTSLFARWCVRQDSPGHTSVQSNGISASTHKYTSTKVHKRTVEYHLQVPTLCPANSSPAENTAFFFASLKQGVSETIHVNKIYVMRTRSCRSEEIQSTVSAAKSIPKWENKLRPHLVEDFEMT